MSGDGIQVQGVRRSFGSVHAVRDVSFSAAPGRVTALVGPNGSGKTTLMLMLASLLAPDAGSTRICGHDPVTDPRAVRAAVGWMPDLLGSWPSLSVRTTLELAARLYGRDRAAARARAAQLLPMADLADLAEQPTRVLSRGQKQRLSLARSLVHDPAVLLLDEPASGLDPGARVRLRHLLRSLADEGRTILISSHELAELDELADTAVFLDAGVTVSESRVQAARVGTRDWRIVATDPARLQHALLEAGFREPAVRAAGAATLLAIEGGPERAAAVLADLVGRGAPIVSYAPAVGELEHAFLDLTREGR